MKLMKLMKLTKIEKTILQVLAKEQRRNLTFFKNEFGQEGADAISSLKNRGLVEIGSGGISGPTGQWYKLTHSGEVTVQFLAN